MKNLFSKNNPSNLLKFSFFTSILACCSYALLTHANNAIAADPGSFYIKAGAGIMMSPNTAVKIVPTDSAQEAKYDNLIKYGSTNDKIFGGSIGYYAAEDMRVEVSASYSKITADTKAPGSLEVKNITGLARGFYDINPEGFFNPYIHAGVGMSQVTSIYEVPAGGINDNDGNAITFMTGKLDSGSSYQMAYNAGFGFNINIAKRFAINLEYAINNGIDQDIKTYSTEKVTVKSRSDMRHTISAGVAIIF